MGKNCMFAGESRGAAMAIINPIPGPGEPQQRLPAGERSGDQDQQRGDAAIQADEIAGGSGADRNAEAKVAEERAAAGAF